MLNTLIILGTGGNASDICDIVDAINRAAPVWRIAGLLDDARPQGSQFAGLPVLGPLRDAQRMPQDCWFVNAVGSDRSHLRRAEIVASTRVPLDRFATLVHPAAAISGRAAVGRGTYACPGVVVTGGAHIGNHVHLGAGCTIGHDAVIDDYAMIGPGAVVSGFVHIGAGSYIGAGAMLRQRVCVGERGLVGMGAVVLNDVPDRVTVIGNPARKHVRMDQPAAVSMQA